MSTYQEVLTVLASTLQLGDRARSFGPDTRLLGSLPELDSMAVVTLITGLEEHFAISVDDDEISADTFESVDSLVRFVERKRAA